MSYICLKPMKVQNLDTGLMERRGPGDAVPEAATWVNVLSYINRGFIAATTRETANASGYARDRLKPMVAATAKDIERGKNAPVPKSGEPLPDAKYTEDTSTEDTGEDTTEELSDNINEMLDLNRMDLNALALEHGIDDPARMGNKKAVVAAIKAAQG